MVRTLKNKKTAWFLKGLKVFIPISNYEHVFVSGYKYMFEDKLVTIWSAPNYCYRCGNIAAVLAFGDAENKEAKLFRAVPDSERVIPPRSTTPYFL